MKKNSWKKVMLFTAVSGLLGVFCAGCSTPQPLPQGPITADEIRGFANYLAPRVLAMPEIASSQEPVRIELQDFSNRTSLMMDKKLFSKSLSIYLNRHGADKVRFVNTDEITNEKRRGVIKLRDEDLVRENLKKIGAEIAALDWVQKRSTPLKIAVIPVVNTNFAGMNADSMTVLLRSEIASAAGGKIQFLMSGELRDADYYLTGEFFPESLTTEGRVDLLQYIKMQEEHVRQGKSFSFYYSSNIDMSKIPNVTKQLNIMLVKPDNKVCVYEKLVRLERKVASSSAKVNYILKGYLGDLAARRRGSAYHYFQFSIQLVDVESNEIMLEDAYEIERVGREDAVYQ